MELIVLLVIVALFLIVMLVGQYVAYREREALVDRLMAKSLPEYKDNQTTEPNEITQVSDSTVSLEDAEADLTDYAQED